MATTHLVLLLVFSIMVNNGVFAEDDLIDCGSGSSVPFTDSYGTEWDSDNSYMKTGVTRTVQPRYAISHVMDTMRVFTERKKNCYNFDSSSGNRFIIRANFYYGNYDQKLSPPTFDLIIDSDVWATVETSTTKVVEHEIIYTGRSDTLSVCLARTNAGQFPFISALEVRLLSSGMYNYVDSNQALFTISRTSFGADLIVGAGNDGYNRVWNPAPALSGLIDVTSDVIPISVYNADYPPPSVLQNGVTTLDVYNADYPPPSVLQNGVTTLDTSNSMILLSEDMVPQNPCYIYMNLYFSEFKELDPNVDKRSFEIVLNGKTISNPIVPGYGNSKEMTVYNVNATSDTNLLLVATTDSTLPPLLNAMEFFYVSATLSYGTNAKDVKGLTSLVKQFEVLGEWGGDPCIPSQYSWEWIICTSDLVPRVTGINLRSFDLIGSLPDFSSMDALQTIDFSNNHLEGPVPDFFASFPDLKLLNLANNKFSGAIPSSLSDNKKIKLVTTGNPYLCESCPSQTYVTGSIKTKNKNKTGAIAGSSVSGFLVFWGVTVALVIARYRRKKAAAGNVGANNKPNGGPQEREQPATKEFNVDINVDEQVFMDPDDIDYS